MKKLFFIALIFLSCSKSYIKQDRGIIAGSTYVHTYVVFKQWNGDGHFKDVIVWEDWGWEEKSKEMLMTAKKKRDNYADHEYTND